MKKMKRFFRIFALLLTLTLAGGCLDRFDSELTMIERRIRTLEEYVGTYNATLEGLRVIVENILEKSDFVQDVKPVFDSEGEIISYEITFEKSGTITLSNGTDGDTPVLCFKQGEDGLFYWAVSYDGGEGDFIVLPDTGQKVAATAISPRVKIEEGNWYVSYNEGRDWVYLGPATGKSGTSFVSDITTENGYVKITFLDGFQVNLPTADMYRQIVSDKENANSNLESLKSLYDIYNAMVYAKSISPIYSGGKVIGYRLYFSDGRTLAFYNGTNRSMPQITAAEDGDALYWKVTDPESGTSQWLTVDGEKVRADAPQVFVPRIGLERDEDNIYYWTVSYDGGETYQWLTVDGEKVMAQPDVPANPVSAVTEYGSRYYQITVNGESVLIPRFPGFTISIESSVMMVAGETVSLNYYIAEADEHTQILPVAQDGFTAWIQAENYSRGKLVITAPSTFIGGTSRITLLVSDGAGTLNSTIITIGYGK
ncbi:MAG: hypothetical protein IKO77_04985 [Bacteroidales bacterium]|nr:hypothetical protein [Bacteroidales bacterium]